MHKATERHLAIALLHKSAAIHSISSGVRQYRLPNYCVCSTAIMGCTATKIACWLHAASQLWQQYTFRHPFCTKAQKGGELLLPLMYGGAAQAYVPKCKQCRVTQTTLKQPRAAVVPRLQQLQVLLLLLLPRQRPFSYFAQTSEPATTTGKPAL